MSKDKTFEGLLFDVKEGDVAHELLIRTPLGSGIKFSDWKGHHVTITKIEPEPEPLRCFHCESEMLDRYSRTVGVFPDGHAIRCRECNAMSPRLPYLEVETWWREMYRITHTDQQVEIDRLTGELAYARVQIVELEDVKGTLIDINEELQAKCAELERELKFEKIFRHEAERAKDLAIKALLLP